MHPRLSGTTLIVAVALLAIGYFAVTSGRYAYHNYRLNQQESLVREDIAQLDRDREQLTAVRDYLKSDEYIEDVARRTLGLVHPGETLVIVSGAADPAAVPTPGPTLAPGDPWWKRLFVR